MAQTPDSAKAVLYGQFVLAAYGMYKNPGSDPLRPQPSGIPPGYELGAWIQMSDFILGSEEPKFYGIVVHEISDPTSRVIAIRGTESAVEWMDDGFALPVPFRQAPNAGRVAQGFDKIYSTLKVIKYTPPGARAAAMVAGPETFPGSFAEQLDQVAQSYEAARGMAPAVTSASGAAPRPLRPTVVTGHSLGGALTTLFVLENSTKHKFDIKSLCTFASPRIGNMEFARTFNQLAIDSWRIVNTLDLVPKLPPHIPVLLDYDHVDTAYPFSSDGFAKNNLICWHSMQTYLHSLDANQAVDPECKP